MKRGGWNALLLAGTLALAAVPPHAAAEDALEYQRRADRYEGVRPKPVSGFDVELLAAQVDFSDDPETLGERFRVRFFLKQTADVHLVVRELDYRYYYWLDRISPKSPWQAGYGNLFEWPTAEVVRRLGDLRISDLGAVARLGRDTPSATEEVAPVLFYQSRLPSKVDGYVFRFRLRDDARIKASVFRADGGEPLVVRDLGRQLGGRPFSFRWNVAAPAMPEGAYKLVLSGYLLENNQKVGQVVQFYHRPAVQ